MTGPTDPTLSDGDKVDVQGQDDRHPDSSAVVGRLFRDHNRDLVHFVQARLGPAASEANEVAQEAYVRLLQLGNAGTISFLRAYLFKIAANLALDRIATNKRRSTYSGRTRDQLENIADPLDVERRVLAAEEYAAFVAAIEELPPKCRQAFLLHRMNQNSSAEVARLMGISTRMVRKHVARALVYCRCRLDGSSPAAAQARLGPDHE